MFRGCSFATVFWMKLGVDVASIPDTTRLWEISRPDTVPHQLFPTLILLCCCNSGSTAMVWCFEAKFQTWNVCSSPARRNADSGVTASHVA